MSNRGMIMRECDRMNETRRVYEGKIDSSRFFRTIRGDLLMTGNEAGDQEMMLDLVCSCMERGDLPTLVLSGHMELLRALQEKRSAREITRVMTSCPSERNYMPFYGMSARQIMRFVRMAAEELGEGALSEEVMIYTAAALNIVSARYPLSLPALTKLLEEDDASISEFALRMGLPDVTADNIRGNHQAGIVLRRLCEYLEEVFEEIYAPGSDTKYNLQSGAQGNAAVMAVYACSGDQHIMNAYWKEEIYHALKRVPRLRVILDEMPFEGEDDEMLKYLLTAKRQGKIELILSVKNAGELLTDPAVLDFANIVLSRQSTPAATDALSRELFGTYQCHCPVPAAGDTPHILFSVKKAVHWQIRAEERLRVRSLDLCRRQTVFHAPSGYLAVKTTANDNVYLIRASDFLPRERDGPRGTGIRAVSGVTAATVILTVVSLLAAVGIAADFNDITARIAIFTVHILSSGFPVLVVITAVIYFAARMKWKIRRRFWRW